jgi:predicted Zn-dependent protease with MMP-like domain
MRFHQLMLRADRVVQRTLAALPPDLREPAAGVPTVYERAPNPALVEDDGIEPDTLGLFVGPTHAEGPSSDVLPSQILLFLDNIWDYAAGDSATFDHEVRLTYLHELGHYLGLDEADLEKRGLD